LIPVSWLTERIEMYVCSHLFLTVAGESGFQDADSKGFVEGAAVVRSVFRSGEMRTYLFYSC